MRIKKPTQRLNDPKVLRIAVMVLNGAQRVSDALVTVHNRTREVIGGVHLHALPLKINFVVTNLFIIKNLNKASGGTKKQLIRTHDSPCTLCPCGGAASGCSGKWRGREGTYWAPAC
jgi:hypothetical protein